MWKKIIFVAGFLMGISGTILSAQEMEPISGNEMEFWVGEWNLEWDINGNIGHGSNSVTKTLGGAVIHEHFRGISGPYAGYLGESFTTYNPRLKTYFQTWVDNNGGYLDFDFDREEGNYIFKREVNFGQGPVQTRMIFYDIEPHSFTWDWQRENTETGEWNLQWRIHYTRKDRVSDVSMEQFEWLTGRWQNSESGDYEVWRYAEDKKSLIGYAVSYNEDKTDSTFTERLKLVEQDGNFIFVAHPLTQESSTNFDIISAGNKNFVSYNPDNDFPQRVEYHRLGPDRLGAIIRDDKRAARFIFVRVKKENE